MGSIDQFLGLNRIAVVGVSADRAKFGNKVYRHLRSTGYQVWAVNPGRDEVEGDRCYHSLADLPQMPEGVVSIIPPIQAEALVRQSAELGIPWIWFQPGAESSSALKLAEASGMKVVANQCLLVLA